MQGIRGLLVVAMAALAAACDAKGKLEPTDLYGEWALQVDGNAACSGAAGAQTRYFTVDGGALESGTLNVVESWDIVRPFRGYGWTVTGNMNLERGTVELNFWHTTLVVGSVFTGTIDDEGRITGIVRDPKPGYSPHFVLGSCQFSARGARVTP